MPYTFVVLITLSILIFQKTLSSQEAKSTQRSTVAFTCLTNGYWQIWAKNIQGEANQLTNSSYDKRTPVWAPDGKKILYRSGNRELFLVDLVSGEEEEILKDLGWGTDPTFLNDGNRIVFSRFDKNLNDDSDLWMSDLEGKDPRVLTKRPGLDYSPAISPDGKRMVYVSGKGFGTHELYLLEFESGKETRLTQNRALELHPTWSPTGQEIAYASDESGNYNIYVMDLKARKPNRITDWEGADLSPAWAPNGKQIAFTSDRSGKLQIWLMEVDGKNARLFSDEKSLCQEPNWQ